MNPDDDGGTMSEDEMMDEEYIGAMQNACDALEAWWPYRFTNPPHPVEAFAADRALRDALVAWQAVRKRNREIREARTEQEGE